MNLSTERIENHRAQFTIEIEAEQLEDAKRKAARKISRQVRIKGFRKGKAPYGLVLRHVGESAVLEEALEALGDRLYKQALDESEVVPYGPGAFEDFKPEPAPTFVFTVPLQPEVDLKDYLAARVDFEEPAVTDDQVDDALKQMRMQRVQVLDAEVAVTAPGHRVTIAVDSEFLDGEPPDEDVEAPIEDALTADRDADSEASAADSEEDAPYVPKRGDTFVKDDNTQIILDPNEDPFTHGFVGNLIDVERGSDVEFELTIPDDDAEESIIGRRVWFVVTIKDIEAIAMPDLDDEFARQASRERGDEALDLAGLRQSLHDELMRTAQDNSRREYSAAVLRTIVDGAEINYPELMLEEHIDGMIGEFEGNLRQRRLGLDDYLRMTGTTKDDLREQYRENAIRSVRHTLVMREIVDAQKIEVSDDDIEMRMESVIAGYGANPQLRKIFDTQEMRGNFRNELVMNHLDARLAAIGQGQEPGAAIDDMRARIAADAERARERRERLDRYKEEDDAASENASADIDADDSGAVDSEGGEPQALDVAATDTGNA